MKSYRLNHVAKIFNIGISTIVEILSVNGFHVENKPTTKITREQIEIVAKDLAIEINAILDTWDRSLSNNNVDKRYEKLVDGIYKIITSGSNFSEIKVDPIDLEIDFEKFKSIVKVYDKQDRIELLKSFVIEVFDKVYYKIEVKINSKSRVLNLRT